jgi:hypothetical protein
MKSELGRVARPLQILNNLFFAAAALLLTVSTDITPTDLMSQYVVFITLEPAQKRSTLEHWRQRSIARA